MNIITFSKVVYVKEKEGIPTLVQGYLFLCFVIGSIDGETKFALHINQKTLKIWLLEVKPRERQSSKMHFIVHDHLANSKSWSTTRREKVVLPLSLWVGYMRGSVLFDVAFFSNVSKTPVLSGMLYRELTVANCKLWQFLFDMYFIQYFVCVVDTSTSRNHWDGGSWQGWAFFVKYTLPAW